MCYEDSEMPPLLILESALNLSGESAGRIRIWTDRSFHVIEGN